jgi:hypothetical protein
VKSLKERKPDNGKEKIDMNIQVLSTAFHQGEVDPLQEEAIKAEPTQAMEGHILGTGQLRNAGRAKPQDYAAR